jgi:hypothetical protein
MGIEKTAPFEKVIPFIKHKPKNPIFVSKNKHKHDG